MVIGDVCCLIGYLSREAWFSVRGLDQMVNGFVLEIGDGEWLLVMVAVLTRSTPNGVGGYIYM